MSLDSPDAHSTADAGKRSTQGERKTPLGTGLLCSAATEERSWVYLFVHRAKVEKVSRKLRERFETFFHTSIVYRRVERRIVKEEQQTIPGLVFVHGAPDEVQSLLTEQFYGVHLVRHYGKGCAAQIADREMRQFMQIAGMGAHSIRLLLHPLEFYSPGHTRVRITSGDLRGYEGYILRIARDRRLVTAIGNMTVAIGGICKESIENAREYAQEKKRLADDGQKEEEGAGLTPLQREIGRCMFDPQCELDAMAMAKVLDGWMERASRLYQQRQYGECAQISVGVLEEVGRHIPARYLSRERCGLKPTCELLGRMLAAMGEGADDETKEYIAIECESLAERYPQLPIGL